MVGMALELPDELIVEIMVRLPVEAIARCKCVSKPWYLYLSDLDFRRRYLRRLNGHLLGVFQFQDNGSSEREQIRKISFLPTSAEESFPISKNDFMTKLGFFFDSSGVLVLCGFHPMTYYVCNPVTNKWISLPKPSTIPAANGSWVAVGIYCGEDNYTVVRAVVGGPVIDHNGGLISYNNKAIHIETYSSETAVWSAATVKGAVCFFLLRGVPCTSIKGIFFWKTTKGQFVAYDPRAAMDQLWVVGTPTPCFRMFRCLGESADGLIQCASDYSWGEISIHVLKRELRSYSYSKRLPQDEWVLKHSMRFDIPGMVSFDRDAKAWLEEDENYPRRLGFHPRNPRILYVKVGNKIFCLDIDTGLVEDVPYHGKLDHVPENHPGWDFNPCWVFEYNFLPFFRPAWPLFPLP